MSGKPKDMKTFVGSLAKGPEYSPYIELPLRFQVDNYKVSTQNHNYDSQYRNPQYPIARYFGPIGFMSTLNMALLSTNLTAAYADPEHEASTPVTCPHLQYAAQAMPEKTPAQKGRPFGPFWRFSGDSVSL